MEQSNVTRLPSRPASQLGPDTTNPVANLIAAIDGALGDKWSFDVLEHHEIGDETIVFTRMIIDGKHRIGIGGTEEKGSLAHRLNSATLDALTRAAAWMGIAPAAACAAQPQPEPVPESPQDAASRITRKQLDYAISLARERGIPRDKLVFRCLTEWKKKPEYLTRAEASTLIESLREVA